MNCERCGEELGEDFYKVVEPEATVKTRMWRIVVNKKYKEHLNNLILKTELKERSRSEIEKEELNKFLNSHFLDTEDLENDFEVVERYIAQEGLDYELEDFMNLAIITKEAKNILNGYIKLQMGVEPEDWQTPHIYYKEWIDRLTGYLDDVDTEELIYKEPIKNDNITKEQFIDFLTFDEEIRREKIAWICGKCMNEDDELAKS